MPSDPKVELLVAFIAALAAALAALIAGGVSFLGLLTSKELQVSGFRQAWIDSLRANVAGLAAHAYQIVGYRRLHSHFEPAALWDATREDYVGFNDASLRIKFRLNRTEAPSLEVIEWVNKLETLLNDFGHLDEPPAQKMLAEITNGLEQSLPRVLKAEWNRVKAGEAVYQRAQLITFGLFFAATTVAVVLFVVLLKYK